MAFSHKKFADSYSFFERSSESGRIIEKYPDRIPVICERNSHDILSPYIDKNKYLVPMDLTVGQFIYVIRKRLKMPATDALFLFIDGQVFSSNVVMSSIYAKHKNKDGFLYVNYAKETTFGK
jgi:GABA(A) receptor-associated protein